MLMRRRFVREMSLFLGDDVIDALQRLERLTIFFRVVLSCYHLLVNQRVHLCITGILSGRTNQRLIYCINKGVYNYYYYSTQIARNQFIHYFNSFSVHPKLSHNSASSTSQESAAKGRVSYTIAIRLYAAEPRDKRKTVACSTFQKGERGYTEKGDAGCKLPIYECAPAAEKCPETPGSSSSSQLIARSGCAASLSSYDYMYVQLSATIRKGGIPIHNS